MAGTRAEIDECCHALQRRRVFHLIPRKWSEEVPDVWHAS